MNLYLLRHASAGTRRANPLIDVKRPLDKEGKAHCLQLAHVLNARKQSFDRIISSPLKRSLQTAQLIATETGYESKILISNALAPAATYDQFRRMLADIPKQESVLVVGHNPNMTVFAGRLLLPHSAEEPAFIPRVRLRKGSLARMTLEVGPATLGWMLDPRTVRALYAASEKSKRSKDSSEKPKRLKSSRK